MSKNTSLLDLVKDFNDEHCSRDKAGEWVPNTVLRGNKDVQYSIPQRRKQVWLLLEQGYSKRDICRILKIGRAVIEEDIVALDDVLDQGIEELDTDRVLADTLMLLRELEEHAWSDYRQATDYRDRKGYLDTLKELRMEKIRLLQEIGKIRVDTPEHPKVNINFNVQDWGEKAAEDLVKMLIHRELKELPEPEMDEDFGKLLEESSKPET